MALDEILFTAGSSKTAGALPRWDVMKAGCMAANLGHSKKCEAACVSDCAALRDDDGDGYPGVTLEVCGRIKEDTGQCNAQNPSEPGVTVQGRSFTTLEINPTFSGKAKSSCEIAGTVKSDIRYTVVGSDVTLLGAQIPVAVALQALPELKVNPAQSKLKLVRVDGKYASPNLHLDPNDARAACKAIIAKKNELF